MNIEITSDTTRITRTVDVTIEGATDAIPRDWTQKTFRPVRMTVALVNGRIEVVHLYGPSILKGGREGQIMSQRFSSRRDGTIDSLEGTPLPAWAVEVARKIESEDR